MSDIVKWHDLKAWRAPFAGLWRRVKGYEIRKNDRDFKVGDGLALHEWEGWYTGATIYAEVTYMTNGGEWGLPADLCVMSIREVRRVAPVGYEPERATEAGEDCGGVGVEEREVKRAP